ncbi:MAG TPA: DUF1289 domain-containing protein [Rhizomicrobium sp.]|nr:DUF1289 domain-containing protein [Rhizomicrobium sp.]
MISSPCIKVCTIDAASGLCAGCGRSLDEIARWGSMGEAERRAVMAALAVRMRAKGLKPREGTAS